MGGKRVQLLARICLKQRNERQFRIEFGLPAEFGAVQVARLPRRCQQIHMFYATLAYHSSQMEIAALINVRGL